MSRRLLIVTPYESLEAFRELQAGRLLLTALERRRAEVVLHQPWRPLPDLASFDVALGWHYRHTRGNHLFYCKAVEDACAAAGLPFVSSAARFDPHHSATLRSWNAAGLPCAPAQRFRRFADVDLPYPLILRVDGFHRGLYQHRADDAETAAALAARVRSRQGRALDLAVAFVDTCWPDGWYRKRRAYVVAAVEPAGLPDAAAATVLPAHHLRSADWRVHFERVDPSAAAFREHRAYLAAADPYEAVLRAALAALAVPWAAIDYSPRPDGGCVLWEANRNPLMWGDPGYPRARPRTADRRFVAAIVDHVLARARRPAA